MLFDKFVIFRGKRTLSLSDCISFTLISLSLNQIFSYEYITSLDNVVQAEMSFNGQLSEQTTSKIQAALNQLYWPTPVITPLQRQEREGLKKKKELEQEIKEREAEISRRKDEAKKQKEETEKEKAELKRKQRQRKRNARKRLAKGKI